MQPQPDPPLVDFSVIPRRLQSVAGVVGALALVGCVVDGALNGLTFALMGRWAGLFVIGLVAGTAVLTAVHALGGADRASRRGQRLASPDVGLSPRRLSAVPPSAEADETPTLTGDQRRERLEAARLYLCTPLRSDMGPFLDAVLQGGVDIVQLRDKTASRAEQLAAAPTIRRLTDQHGALFIINDDPSLAVEAGADGVHVGQDDMSPDAARVVVGPDLLIGWSTHATDEVDAAQQVDCDYFAVGPVSATPTKQGRPGIGLDPLRHAAAVATRPWFVTGGMAADTVGPVLAAGATRVVVVRALTQATDPQQAARDITAALED